MLFNEEDLVPLYYEDEALIVSLAIAMKGNLNRHNLGEIATLLQDFLIGLPFRYVQVTVGKPEIQVHPQIRMKNMLTVYDPFQIEFMLEGVELLFGEGCQVRFMAFENVLVAEIAVTKEGNQTKHYFIRQR